MEFFLILSPLSGHLVFELQMGALIFNLVHDEETVFGHVVFLLCLEID